MTGAFAGRNAGIVFPVVSATCKVIDRDGNNYAAEIHEALYDDSPLQRESLLAVHQALMNKSIGIDDRSLGERDIFGRPGHQASKFQGHLLPFHFDGVKCFYEIVPISSEEMRTLPRILLSSPANLKFNPNNRMTTRLVKRGATIDWKATLAFIPQHVIDKTMLATTQMVPSVQAETREIMRDHFQSRLPELKVMRKNDILYIDTFFSSVPSIRGYKCWNLFCYAKTGLDIVIVQRYRTQSLSALKEVTTQCGVPHTVHTDNAMEFKSARWNAYHTTMQIIQQYSETEHQNENIAERRGGVLKAAVVHVLTITQAPLNTWCYCLEYVTLVYQVIARRSLGWRSAYEKHWGHTPDISMFRFSFWQPIWYYTPRRPFPKSKMLKGRFVGLAATTGDAFCYLIFTEPDEGSREKPQVLARSVIRKRYPRTDAPIVSHSKDNKIAFYLSDGKSPIPDPEGEYLSDTLEHRNETLLDQVNEDDSLSVKSTSSDIVDVYRDGIIEVLGPPTKRQRLETDCIEEETPISESPYNPTPTNMDDGGGQESNIPLVTQPECTDVDLPLHHNATTSHSQPSQEMGAVDDGQLLGTPPVQREVAHVEDDVDDDEGKLISDQVNTQLHREANNHAEDEDFDSVISHEWNGGTLLLELQWKSGDNTKIPFSLAHIDYPVEVADYILFHKVGRSKLTHGSGRYLRWARRFRRTLQKSVRRMVRRHNNPVPLEAYECPQMHVDEVLTTAKGDAIPLVKREIYPAPHLAKCRRLVRKRKRKPGRISRPRLERYGVTIPRDVRDAYRLDTINGDTGWADAVHTEIDSLKRLKCFKFLAPEFKPDETYQYCDLIMIFEVKADGRKKARYCAGGHKVALRGMSSKSTVVKQISVRLMDIIAHRDNLDIICGDIGNAFITAPCLEKVYSIAGPEWGDRQDAVMIFLKALYGLKSSSRAFRAHFAEFLRSMGFIPTRHDRDCWMRLRDTHDGYDYICTHVDDFKIVARNPSTWVGKIQDSFLLKHVGSPAYYLGNDYTYSEKYKGWFIGCHTYLTECIRRVESENLFGINAALYPHKTPLPEGTQPELDTSPLLDEKGIKAYQSLIGMAQWAATILRLDINFATSSLSRFSVAPREGHYQLALHLFGYLKRHKNKRLLVDSRNIILDDDFITDATFHPDFLDEYKHAKEEIPDDLPKAFGTELQTSIFFDADFAHDVKTRRSITGLIVNVGRTPVEWYSKRQGCIATSTYCAEFIAMRAAVECAISLRYVLRCMGIPVIQPTNLYGDNLGVMQSATIPDSDLKKKHVAVSYHFVREAVASKIINAYWVRSYENYSDICTKALGGTVFHDLGSELLY